MSSGLVAALRRPKIRRSRSACWAWIPACEPVSKNLDNPLCLNPRINELSVTYKVTDDKTVAEESGEHVLRFDVLAQMTEPIVFHHRVSTARG